MQTLEQLTGRVLKQENLSSEAAGEAARLLASAAVDAAPKRAFLLALADKGETATEVAAFAQTFRDLAMDPEVGEWADRAIDVCGTGGDGSGTFNISTAVSFVVAAAGVPVFKHGNRSITSKCGSADLLEAVGVRLDAPQDLLHASLRELDFCFFFAPAYHPAFKEIMPVRKALAAEGRRTIFNLLGPLINPGRPAHQLLGVYAPQWVEPLAAALHEIGLRSGLVVHGQPAPDAALDELSCVGQNRVAGFGALQDASPGLSAADAGLPGCSIEDLRGGDVGANLRCLQALLSGRPNAVPAGLRDSVLLNAGAALWIAGQANDLAAGVVQARDLLGSGKVLAWLDRVREFYAKG